MASNALVLVLSAGGRVGATGRYVTEDLLDRGLPVRAWVRVNDDRALPCARSGPMCSSATCIKCLTSGAQ